MLDLPYTRDTVEITPALAKSGGVTIPVSAVSSVGVSASYHMLTTLGLLMVLVAVLGGYATGNVQVLAVLAVVSALCLWLGAKWKIYQVVVGTSAGGWSTFASTTREDVANEIKSALETAVSGRG